MKGLKALALATLVLGSVQAQAQNAGSARIANPVAQPTATLSHYKDFGFESKTEMKNYFAVDRIDVQEVESPLTPELRRHLEDISRSMKITIELSDDSRGTASPSRPAATPTPAPKPNPDDKPSIGPKPGPAPGPTAKPTPKPGGDSSIDPTDIIDVIMDPTAIDKWITIGQKIWAVIVANKPVANVSSQRISVLPMAQQDWAQMENWQGPTVRTFTIAAKNGFGMTVVSQTYTVAYNYGGQYNGKGQFLANATVIPANIEVMWGFSLSSEVEVGDVVNTGTKENPIPGVDLQVKWKMDSVMKHMEGRDSFFVKGDGKMVHVTGGL